MSTADHPMPNDLLESIHLAVRDFVDPAKRIAFGVRLYVDAAHADPLLAAAMLARGVQLGRPQGLLHVQLPKDIAAGIETGRFMALHMDTALDLVAGTTLAAVARILRREAWPGHGEHAAGAILRGLGVPAMQAARLVRIELPRLPARTGRAPKEP